MLLKEVIVGFINIYDIHYLLYSGSCVYLNFNPKPGTTLLYKSQYNRYYQSQIVWLYTGNESELDYMYFELWFEYGFLEQS